MKKRIAFALAFVFALLLLAGCGGSNSSSSSSPVTPAVSSEGASVAAPYDVDALLAAIAPAANLGDGPVTMVLLDLTAGGDVTRGDVLAMAGQKSADYYENGGMVIVLQVQPGRADSLKGELELFRDAQVLFLQQYPEFQDGIANTQNAYIYVNGDYVVYAVSTTAAGEGNQALIDAVDAAFA